MQSLKNMIGTGAFTDRAQVPNIYCAEYRLLKLSLVGFVEVYETLFVVRTFVIKPLQSKIWRRP